MSSVPEVAQAMSWVLTAGAQQAAAATGLAPRRSRLTGPGFVQMLVFGWLADPDASLCSLTQMVATLGAPISSQARFKRFTPQGGGALAASPGSGGGGGDCRGAGGNSGIAAVQRRAGARQFGGHAARCAGGNRGGLRRFAGGAFRRTVSVEVTSAAGFDYGPDAGAFPDPGPDAGQQFHSAGRAATAGLMRTHFPGAECQKQDFQDLTDYQD